jgi:hypothetical protein
MRVRRMESDVPGRRTGIIESRRGEAGCGCGARAEAITFLLGVAVSSGGWSAAGFLYLRDMGLNLRFRPVGELDSLLASGLLHTRPAGTPASQKAFLHLLERERYPPARSDGGQRGEIAGVDWGSGAQPRRPPGK